MPRSPSGTSFNSTMQVASHATLQHAGSTLQAWSTQASHNGSSGPPTAHLSLNAPIAADASRTNRPLDTDRRIAGNGRIISAWPIRTDVLFDDGLARVACGLFPQQGTYQFAIDVETGDIVSQGDLAFSPQGYLKLQGDRLMVAQVRWHAVAQCFLPGHHQPFLTIRRRRSPRRPARGFEAQLR